jgi:hypothetical protein
MKNNRLLSRVTLFIGESRSMVQTSDLILLEIEADRFKLPRTIRP